MAERIVVALGGNALGKTPEQQLELVRNTARPIVDLVEKGYEVIIGHGNGPQVGMINLAMEFSANKGGGTPFMPFPECGAMTQGYIGYHLQQAIQQELKSRGMEKECATVVTQVVVDEKDPGFQHPTKPVGSFYTKEEAEKIAEEKGFIFVEDAGRGYRRVVPSPIPKRIVELNVVDQLVRAGDIVITVGGGGIPVVETEDGLRGVASLVVVAFHLFEAHAASHADQIINHGYLAVDFFFVLSGFVIGYAYDDRWGRMTYRDFFKRRLIRLHPMVVMGMLIGAAAFSFGA